MKKIKKLLSVLMSLTLLAAATAAAGCTEETPTDPDAALKEDVLLQDFEAWVPDLQLARIFNSFGKISLNADKQYVSHGEKSARLDPLGSPGSGAFPMVYFPTQSTVFNFNHSDFSYVDYLSFDLYNANAEEKTVKAGFVSKITSITSVNKVGERELTLQPGWNYCRLEFNPSIVAITADIKSVQGVYFSFENAHSVDVTEDTPKYYLDNVRLIKKEEKNPDKVELPLNKGEIVDFERLYQQYTVYNDNPGILEVVGASDYGLEAPSGEKILRVVLSGTNTGYWKQFTLSEKLLARAFEVIGMDQTLAKRAYICFESYNNTNATVNLPLDYTVGTSGKSVLSTTNNTAPKRWTTYEYKLSKVLDANSGILENPGAMTINYKDDSAEDREFFFDNFRIEIR